MRRRNFVCLYKQNSANPEASETRAHRANADAGETQTGLHPLRCLPLFGTLGADSVCARVAPQPVAISRERSDPQVLRHSATQNACVGKSRYALAPAGQYLQTRTLLHPRKPILTGSSSP